MDLRITRRGGGTFDVSVPLCRVRAILRFKDPGLPDTDLLSAFDTLRGRCGWTLVSRDGADGPLNVIPPEVGEPRDPDDRAWMTPLRVALLALHGRDDCELAFFGDDAELGPPQMEALLDKSSRAYRVRAPEGIKTFQRVLIAEHVEIDPPVKF